MSVNRVLQKKVIDFIKANPYPEDEKFHTFAESLGMSPHELEDVAYSLLSDVFAQGKGDDEGAEELPPKELKKGLDVEKEHTSNPMIAKEIVEDHELESKDNTYYEKLDDMEKEMKEEDNKIAFLQNKLSKVLSPKGRKHVAKKNFVFPKERKYPIHDLSHARNALARVSQHGTPSEQSKVRSAVYSKYPGLKKRKEERGKLAARACSIRKRMLKKKIQKR